MTAMDTVTTIKQRRVAAGMTQFELAVASGVSPATIHRIEAGTTNPTQHVIDALERALTDSDIGGRLTTTKQRATSTTQGA